MSIINSEEVKTLVIKVVEKMLDECAFQHKASGMPYTGYDSQHLTEEGLPTPLGLVEPTKSMKAMADTEPVQLKLTFEFYWEGSEKSNLFCQPVIDLSDIVK